MRSCQSTGCRQVSLLFLAVLMMSGPALAQSDPQPLPVAKGVYRLPYADDTTVRFSNDHTNHPAMLNRIDMTGQDGGPYTVVAAAGGWIRILVDNNSTFCPDADIDGDGIADGTNDIDGDGTVTTQENQQCQTNACGSYGGSSANCCERDFEANGGTCPNGGTCNAPNNYVWIEHPNGEWTKYTHMLQGTVTGSGWSVGDWIDAGEALGTEGDVGIASGPHVHFEVAVPYHVQLPPDNDNAPDPDSAPDSINEWFTASGFLVEDGIQDDVVFDDPDQDGVNDPDDDVNRQNRIPVFCQLGFAGAGETATAGPCDDACGASALDLSGTTVSAGDILYNQVSEVMGNPNDDFVAQSDSGVAIRAGGLIVLSPGFHAEPDACFSASIGACDTPGGIDE